MEELSKVVEAAHIAELQKEETLTPEKELAKLLAVEAGKAVQKNQLNLSRETVLRILELFSKRECLTDDERKFIREMVSDLSNELKDSKYAQAGIHLVFAIAGGSIGAIGSGFWDGADSLGSMIREFGTVSDHFHSADQVWMEVGKQLRMNDMSQEDSLSEKIHREMDRVMQAVEAQDSTIQRARTR